MIKLLQLLFLLAILSHPAMAEESSENDDSSTTKTLLWPDGTRYVGGVKDGKRFGKGTIFWQDGTRFVGTFVDDQRNGPGTMILPDGTVYNGYFENDSLVERADGPAIASSEPTPPIAEISASDVPSTITETLAQAEEPVQASPTVADTETIAQIDAPSDAEAITTLSQETREQIQAAIDLWAAAWSDQNIEQYLAIYSADFAVPGRQSRRQWEGMRRARLTRPSRIEVRVNYDSFELIAPNTVQVDFNQIYDSNLYSDKTNKRLVMKKVGGGLWRIISERSL
tara:strand:+ start:57633 stop:58481 length:849 start_codon:yes stop_codon:yes gene_type:complete